MARRARKENAGDIGVEEEWISTEVTCSSKCVPSPSSQLEGHSRGDEARRVWSKIKHQYKLVEFHALPDYLRDNEYILNHYRADWPLKHTLLSIFSLHNETLNIWTHLIGFLFFLGLTILAAMEIDRVHGWDSIGQSLSSVPLFNQHLNKALSYFMPNGARCAASNNSSTAHSTMEALKDDVLPTPARVGGTAARWPFFVFLMGAMTCLLTSSTSHLLSCHSRRMSSVMWRLDYAGIAAMIATSFYPPIYYVFQCDPAWQMVYLGGITALGIATICATLLPCLTSPKYRIFRTCLFVGMGLSGIIPGAHALVQNWHEPMCFTVLSYELAMVFFYLSGTTIYAARIPERWKPGFFDIAGHSHQIFHVMVIAGAYAHYRAALVFLEWRNANGCHSL